jgi:hypothetical protein
MTLFKFFALVIHNLTLKNLSGLCTETVEVARTIINLLAPGLLTLKFNALDASSTTLRAMLNRARASPLTEELRILDGQIKEKLDEIKRVVLAFEKSSIAPKAAAAKRLLPVFKPFWDVTSDSLIDQEAELKELRQRIASVGNNLEALTTLELMDTWLAFTALDDTFHTLYSQRLQEDALALPAAGTIQDTVVTDYEAFCNTLSLTLASEPTAQLEMLFKEMDDLRKKYAPPHRRRLDRVHTSATSIADQPYDNDKAVQPFVRVFYKTDDETAELVFTVDFEVSYKNNKKVGDALMIIHGKGKYVGQFLISFHIVRTN